jgi:hypothetical protein
MANIFQIDDRDLKKLIKFYKRAPREFTKAAASVLNTLAFETRKQNIHQIKKTMTVRGERFVTGSLRVQKTKGNKLNDLMAIAGSIERQRFTGWAEQQLNKPAKRKRLQTVHARGGSFKKRVRQKAKMRRSNNFYTYRDFVSPKAKTKRQATARMMRQIRSGEASRRPAVIESGLGGRLGKFSYGLYEIKKRRIKRLQNLRPRNVQPKRNRWMTRSLRYLDRNVDLRAVWGRSINFVLKKAKL